jgi:hypothetical protein
LRRTRIFDSLDSGSLRVHAEEDVKAVVSFAVVSFLARAVLSLPGPTGPVLGTLVGLTV